MTRAPKGARRQPAGVRRDQTDSAQRTPSSPAAASDAREAWVCAAIAILAAVVVYLPGANNGFVWDDPLVLRQLEHFHTAGDLFQPPEAVPKFYYRPFVFLTFLVDRWIGGGTPRAFHLTVIAWHALAAGLVFVLIRQLLGAGHAIEAGLAATLFAVHPVHVESVAWIAGRSDVIATAFVLLALVLAAPSHRPWTAWATAGAVLLGCWSKEVALAALLLIPARDLLLERRLAWHRYLPLLLAAGIYAVSRLRGLGMATAGSPTDASAPQLVRDLMAATAWYAWKALIAIPLTAYVPRVPDAMHYAFGGAVVMAAVVASFVWARRRGQMVAAFWLLWWVATLAPSLIVIVRRSASAVLAERYLYLPSVAVAGLIAVGLTTLRPRASTAWRAAAAGVVVVALLGATQSIRRAAVWADNLAFWSDAAAQTPDSALVRRELADASLAAGRNEEAEREFQAALALPASTEERVMTLNNLGNLYARQDRLDEAATVMQRGLKLYPHPHLYSGLGRVAMKRAQHAQARGDHQGAAQQVVAARGFLSQAVARDPQDYKSHALLGQVLLNLGERDAARSHLETALRIQPTGTVADVARQYLQRLGH